MENFFKLLDQMSGEMLEAGLKDDTVALVDDFVALSVPILLEDSDKEVGNLF